MYLELLGEQYYLDLDEVTDVCKTGHKIEDESGKENYEINIFKYELLKSCIERVLNEYDQPDNTLGTLNPSSLSPSFSLAFNTLVKYNIIKEEEFDDE